MYNWSVDESALKKNPKKYIPAYGGYCAYAIGAKGTKVAIDPKTFEIRDGKLYLFYNAWGRLWRFCRFHMKGCEGASIPIQN